MPICTAPLIAQDFSGCHLSLPLFTKAISIRQPFARYVANGAKPLEIRSNPTRFRGNLLICSAQKTHEGTIYIGNGSWQLCKGHVELKPELFPTGVMLAVAQLIDCRPMVQADEERALVKYQPGLWAYELSDPIQVRAKSIRGQLGLFEVPFGDIEFYPGDAERFLK